MRVGGVANERGWCVLAEERSRVPEEKGCGG